MNTYSLSRTTNNQRGFESIAKLYDESKELMFEDVELDFKHCPFFEANMSAPLYAVIARLRSNVNDVSLTNLNSEIETILRKNQFLCAFNKPAIHDTYNTVLPFKKFKTTANEQFLEYLDLHLQNKNLPEMSQALTKKFRQSLLEIFVNAAEHSDAKEGIYVCGQFFPRKHKVDFTIADSGVGILENVCQYLKQPNMTADKAIEWALSEGNTTKKGSLPGGLGLKLLTDFISKNQGKLQIISRKGFYEFNSKGETCNQMNYDFPGTCVNIEINTEDNSSYRLSSEIKPSEIF